MGGEPAREITAAHRRHHEIADDQVDAVGSASRIGGRLGAVGGQDHAIARLGQGAGDEYAYDFLVVDDETVRSAIAPTRDLPEGRGSLDNGDPAGVTVTAVTGGETIRNPDGTGGCDQLQTGRPFLGDSQEI